GTCIGDLRAAFVHNRPHLRKIDHCGLVEGRREQGGRNLRNFISYWITSLLPAIEATVENIDILHAHDTKHPPDAWRGKHTRPIVDHDCFISSDTHRTDMLGEKFRRRQRVRQTGFLVGDFILIEENRAWNMSSVVFALAIAPSRGKIPGCIDNRDARLIEPFFQPVARNDESAFLSHDNHSSTAQDSGKAPKRMRKRRFSLPFFSILPMWISPTSCVSETCVPPQGCESTTPFSPMRTRRMRPSPTGGRTFFDFTISGLARTSSSLIQRMATASLAFTRSMSFSVTNSLV